MEWKLEVVVIPVTDIDRAKSFYTGKLGFHLDADTTPTETMRVVHMTPPGSGCSVVIGPKVVPAGTDLGGTSASLQLVVAGHRGGQDRAGRPGCRGLPGAGDGSQGRRKVRLLHRPRWQQLGHPRGPRIRGRRTEFRQCTVISARGAGRPRNRASASHRCRPLPGPRPPSRPRSTAAQGPQGRAPRPCPGPSKSRSTSARERKCICSVARLKTRRNSCTARGGFWSLVRCDSAR